jgi:hypothetical protein
MLVIRPFSRWNSASYVPGSQIKDAQYICAKKSTRDVTSRLGPRCGRAGPNGRVESRISFVLCACLPKHKRNYRLQVRPESSAGEIIWRNHKHVFGSTVCHYLGLRPSRKAMDSSSTRTASSIGITGRASKTKAGNIEQNL